MVKDLTETSMHSCIAEYLNSFGVLQRLDAVG